MFSGRGTHITRDTFSPGRGTHIIRDICFPGRGTQITRDMGEKIARRGGETPRDFFTLCQTESMFTGYSHPS